MATQRQAQRAAEQNADGLSNYPNVVGIGVQPLEVATDQPGERQHAVAVYVERKVPLHELRFDERLPEYLEVAGRGEPVQVPVKVVESGAFAPEFETGVEDGATEGVQSNEDDRTEQKHQQEGTR
jgi:hypothetical protein